MEILEYRLVLVERRLLDSEVPLYFLSVSMRYRQNYLSYTQVK
jgi:hypothetical protein